ncbi:putative ribonuclease H-like domain-containing protein [Tanacetum coccineum]
MDSLSEVSAYLNELENVLDDGDSTMKVEELVEVGTEMERVDAMDVIDAREKVREKVKHEVVVFTKAPFWEYYFGLGEMGIDITMLKEDKDVDTLLANLVEDMAEVGNTSGELVKIALERKYQELEEKKTIIEVLENYMVYRNKLDDVLMGRAMLENKDHREEERERIIEKGLPKKLSDSGNFILPVRVNGVTHLSVLADTRASVSVLPYSLYKNLGLGNPRLYYFDLTMANNTQAKAMGEVRNVRIQIGYQAYHSDFLVLDIPVDKELLLFLGRPFLRTCGALIDMGRGKMTIDDGVIKHTYYPKPRAYKAYLESFEIDEDEDCLGCYDVGRDEDENPKYGPVAPSFLDIEDEMERELAMEAYFNPFKNIIVFKKLIDCLGSLSVQLNNTDWGSKGYGVYKKTKEDGVWHARFEVTTPSGRKFTRGFKTNKTKRKLSRIFTSKDILKFDNFLD